MEKVSLRNINTKYINKKVEAEGILTGVRKQEKRPIKIMYRCPNCKAIATIRERGRRIPKLARCSCGNFKSFEEISKENIYEQRILMHGFKIYLRSKNPIKNIDDIKRKSKIRVRGTIQTEFKKKHTVGEFILLADTIERVL